MSQSLLLLRGETASLHSVAYIIWDFDGQRVFKKMVQTQKKTCYNMASAFLMTKFRKKIFRELDVNRIIRWMLRTKEEVEVTREDNVTLDQRDQTPRASSTLGE